MTAPDDLNALAERLEQMAKEWFRCISVDGNVTVHPRDDGWIRDNANWCRKTAASIKAGDSVVVPRSKAEAEEALYRHERQLYSGAASGFPMSYPPNDPVWVAKRTWLRACIDSFAAAPKETK